MQVQEAFSVPRRALDLEDYIDIARRHKGWIFGPVFAALVAAVVGAFLWPDTYVSTATIKVTPQQVPEVYVQSNINQLMSDRIASIAQTVLSRPVLTSIITTYDLYPRQRQRMPMEDIVEKMRADFGIRGVVDVTNARDRVPAFQVQFAYTDRYKAQKVVSQMVTKIIDTNQSERSASSLGTTQLLKDQLEAAQKQLEGIESRLAEFRERNQGRLPDEMQANLQQLNAFQQRITVLNSSLSRVSQEKLMMESQLRTNKDQLASMQREPVGGETVVKSERAQEADRAVQYYENQLAALRDHYKDSYPDVQRMIGMLASAKKKRDEAIKEDAATAAARGPQQRVFTPQAAREARDLEAAIRRVQSQLEAKQLEDEQYRRELVQADATAKSYQARLEGVPMSEKEYNELTRDRDMSKMKWADLDQKMSKAMIALDMENRKAGENLEQLDPPSLPETPTQPKRAMIVAVGAVIGLMCGIVLAGAREMKDTSLKNLKDVRAYTKLPILGSVPLLENDLVVKRRRRFAWFAWSLACLTGIVVMSGSVIYYYATKN